MSMILVLKLVLEWKKWTTQGFTLIRIITQIILSFTQNISKYLLICEVSQILKRSKVPLKILIATNKVVLT